MKNELLDREAKYLDWVNNFITVSAYAEHYEIEYKEAIDQIADGKLGHEILSDSRNKFDNN